MGGITEYGAILAFIALLIRLDFTVSPGTISKAIAGAYATTISMATLLSLKGSKLDTIHAMQSKVWATQRAVALNKAQTADRAYRFWDAAIRGS